MYFIIPNNPSSRDTSVHMLIVLSLVLTVISGFRISFNPTDKLVELSSAPDYKFFHLLKYIFRDESLWPVLSSFQQARYYNFTPVFASFLGFLKCSEILDVILQDDFPVKQVLNAEILNYDKGLIGCFSRLPIEFFRDRLEINPMALKDYRISLWGFDLSFEFFNAAFYNPKLAANWYIWSNDAHFFKSGLTRFPIATWPWLWKTISFFTINSLPEPINLTLIEVISHGYNSETQFFYRNDRKFRSRLSGMLRWSNFNFDDDEIFFSQDQIMKITTISVLLLVYPPGSLVHQQAKVFLVNSLSVFKEGRRKFPLRRELKHFIRNVIASHSQEREHISLIQFQLISFMKHLKGMVLGPWLLNIFFIWTHFNEFNPSTIIEFIGPFTDVFFASETSITPSDTCLLLDILNSSLYGVMDDEHVTSWIIKTHFPNRLSLAKAVYKDCPSEILKSLLRNSNIFPLSFRVEQLFMESRFITKFTSAPLNIVSKSPPEQVCLSVFNVVNLRIGHSVVLPMNSKVTTSNRFYYGNLKGMLELFFINLMYSASWWLSVNDFGIGGDIRPVLRPSLTFPPHLMECVGVLLAQAVVSNVEIPFLLDQKFFVLANAFDLLQELTHPISVMLQEAYPEIMDGKYTKCRRIHRIISTLHFSTTKVLESMGKMLKFHGIVDIEPNHQELIDICNTVFDVNRIILMGAERLRHGMNLVIPADSLKPKDLYKLIFKHQ